MEKIYYSPDKSHSFRSRHHRRKSESSSPRTPTKLSSIDEFSDIHDVSWRENVVEIDDGVNIDHVSEQIDEFVASLFSFDKDSSDHNYSLQVPEEDVETFSKIVESRIAKYCSPNSIAKFGKFIDEDMVFLESVARMSRLTNALGELPSANSDTITYLNRTSMVLQRAMLFLEEEFINLLEDSNACVLSDNTAVRQDADEGEYAAVYTVYSPDVVAKLKRISSAMFSSEYVHECCHVYSVARRIAFHEELTSFGFEIIGIEDAQRMTWEQLEEKIATWIKALKYSSIALFTGERKLAEEVFDFDESISLILFQDLARNVMIHLLNFVDVVTLTKRSSEKLFKYLDMYEVLNEIVIKNTCSDRELLSEISHAGEKIGEAAVHIFCDLESSIKCESARTPVPGGAIHPLTRYVMNYVRYACEYKDTLEQIFHRNKSLTRSISLANSTDTIQDNNSSENRKSSNSFAIQLMTVFDLLNENLDTKSKLYRDISLRYIFLMNNGRYILQKIKGSKEILQLVGDTWYRTRSTVVRQYHKNYQRETWVRLLQCLRHEGLQASSSKVNKPILKERFKSFNSMFEEIHKVQSTWVVSDEQLQSELRVSVSAVVIPAYRSFVGRFKQYLDSSRQPEKYIKYQPEDVETMIEGLFDGNPNSMGRRR